MRIKFSRLSIDLMSAISTFSEEDARLIFERFKDASSCEYEENVVRFNHNNSAIQVSRNSDQWQIIKRTEKESSILNDILA